MADGEVSEEDLKKMSPEEIAELQKQNCIFCKIASKEIPAKIMHETDDIIAILDINPASEGHILVFPKKHYMIMPHLPPEILSRLFENVKLMSQTLLGALQARGTTIFVANGMAAGQKAPHVLIHVFPRKEGDGLISLPSYTLTDDEREKLKSTISPYLKEIFGSKKNHQEHTQQTKEHSKSTPHEKKQDEKSMKQHSREKLHTQHTSKPTKSSTKSVSLDDIGKLFGG
jgi:histidine triad (HIT) family protein